MDMNGGLSIYSEVIKLSLSKRGFSSSTSLMSLFHYIGQPRRHLLTTGWSTFVTSKRLVAGDAFVFLR